MADTTLAAIRTKIRRMTRSPREAHLTTTQIDEAVNTFILYYFPYSIRLFNLHKNFTWFTEPNQWIYSTNTKDSTNPLYNFKNKYVTFKKPCYIAGYEVLWSQSQEQFFALYPKMNYLQKIGTGNGVTTSFSGTLTNIPVLSGEVTFNSKDSNGIGIILKDQPTASGVTGIPTLSGDLIVPDDTSATYGTINYKTGVYSITFPTAPKTNEDVNAQTVAYVAGRPMAILYYADQFYIQPVPDQSYRVEMEVYARPTALLSSSSSPDLEEWWTFIAVGAAKIVLEDRMDMDSVQKIMPLYEEQKEMVLSRTIVQQAQERSATIYTEQTSLGAGGYWGNRFGTY